MKLNEGEKLVDELEDWRGNKIVPGGLVLYPRMSGRSCEMQEARVQAIVEKPERKQVYDYTRRKHVDDGPLYKIVVVPLNSSRSFGRFGSDPNKPVTIQITENITALLDEIIVEGN